MSLGLTFVYNVVEPKFDSPITRTWSLGVCVCVPNTKEAWQPHTATIKEVGTRPIAAAA